MILTERNQIVFRHDLAQSITETLRARLAVYEAEWLPAILAGDPALALERVLAKDLRWLNKDQKQEIRNDVALLSADRLSGLFRNVVRRKCGLDEAATPQASIGFLRTLRIPDDGGCWPLPPGLGSLPVEPASKYARRVPQAWLGDDGMLVPLHQAEALWMSFSATWPTALKLGTGAMNAVSGRPWSAGLPRKPQGYVVLPEQPWLDGFATAPGVVRQFVATRLGDGYTAEEQVLGSSEGGLHLEAYPLKPASRFDKEIRDHLPRTLDQLLQAELENRYAYSGYDCMDLCAAGASASATLNEMGLAAGGQIKQHIYKDQWELEDWDTEGVSRVRVRLVDCSTWRAITGKAPPHEPPGTADYVRAGLPWFDYYRDDLSELPPTAVLSKLKSVFGLAKAKGDASIPQGDGSPGPENLPVIPLGPDAPKNLS